MAQLLKRKTVTFGLSICVLIVVSYACLSYRRTNQTEIITNPLRSYRYSSNKSHEQKTALFENFTKNDEKILPVFEYSTNKIFKTITRIKNKNCLEMIRPGQGTKELQFCRNVNFCNNPSIKSHDLPAGCEPRLPRAIIIGVYKAGTRELLDFLAMHPKIVIKRQHGYEISFFSTSRWRKGFEWYRQNMPVSMSDQMTIEKSPGYFASRSAPERIRTMNPNVKLILILRDPVERTISHVTFSGKNVSSKLEQLQNSANWSAIFGGLLQFSFYDEQFQHYLKYFDGSQIHIIDSNRFKRDPYGVLYDVESFLDLPHVINITDFVFNDEKGFFCLQDPAKNLSACYGNERGRPNESKLNWDTIKPKLRRLFKSHNERFFYLSGHTFDWT